MWFPLPVEGVFLSKLCNQAIKAKVKKAGDSPAFFIGLITTPMLR